MSNQVQQNLKIKLESTAQFKEAWEAALKLKYQWGGTSKPPRTAQFLYMADTGNMLADYFDVEGADLSSPHSALGYFNACEYKEVTLDELKGMAYGNDIVFVGVHPDYLYYSVDADDQAYYTKMEPHISKQNDYWGKDISMREAPNFKLHTDWKQSLIKRDDGVSVV